MPLKVNGHHGSQHRCRAVDAPEPRGDLAAPRGGDAQAERKRHPHEEAQGCQRRRGRGDPQACGTARQRARQRRRREAEHDQHGQKSRQRDGSPDSQVVLIGLTSGISASYWAGTASYALALLALIGATHPAAS